MVSMRLIDADALFVNLDGMMAVSPTGYIHGDTIADMISDAPTVDAVPVIRCKDCKWYGDGYLCYNTETLGMQPDDYCSLAERKEE